MSGSGEEWRVLAGFAWFWEVLTNGMSNPHPAHPRHKTVDNTAQCDIMALNQKEDSQDFNTLYRRNKMTPQKKAQASKELLKDLIAGKTFSELASNTCIFANIFNKTDKSFDFDFADISGTINNVAGAPSLSPHICLWAADGTLVQEID